MVNSRAKLSDIRCDMSERREKAGVGVWATVVVAFLVLYVLSIGPAAWIDRRVTGPGFFNDACRVVYSPLRLVYNNGPEPVRKAFEWYFRVWNIDSRTRVPLDITTRVPNGKRREQRLLVGYLVRS